MLPKSNRFPFRGNFPKTVLHTPLFTIRYEKTGESLRGAVVVSKKVSKKATERNTLRRIFSESFNQYTQSPYSVVFFVKKGALESEKEALKKNIDSMLHSLLK